VQDFTRSSPRTSQPTGADHPGAKLTDGEVALIRSEYATGLWSYSQLAAKFEVAKATIADIVKGRRR